MKNRTNAGRRLAVASAFFTGALLAGRASQAQAVAADPRWQAWVGCWAPADAPAPGSGGIGAVPLVCVVPAAGTSAVDVATVVDGKVVNRARVEATGERRASTEGECTGWERAQWSSDGRRVYVWSEYTCPGGVQRSSSGLLAMSSAAEWLDVQGVTAGGNTGVRVVRYREAGPTAALPAEIAAVVEGRGIAASAARTAAAAPLATPAVVEASRHLPPAVVEAWLVERKQGFALDAKQLVELADAGVPGRVTDVMVALSYPKTFAINPTSREGELRPAVDTGRVAARSAAVGGPFVVADPYGYGAYGYGPYGYYSPYGYSPYGYDPRYGGWYGTGPVIVIRNPPSNGNGEARSRGRAVNGRGYTRDDPGGIGRDANPRPHVGDGSPSGGRQGGTSPAGSGSGSTGRTAKPRP